PGAPTQCSCRYSSLGHKPRKTRESLRRLAGAGPELTIPFLNEGRIVGRATEGDYRRCIIGELGEPFNCGSEPMEQLVAKALIADCSCANYKKALITQGLLLETTIQLYMRRITVLLRQQAAVSGRLSRQRRANDNWLVGNYLDADGDVGAGGG